MASKRATVACPSTDDYRILRAYPSARSFVAAAKDAARNPTGVFRLSNGVPYVLRRRLPRSAPVPSSDCIALVPSTEVASSDGDMDGNHDCREQGGGVATKEELGNDSSLLFFVVSSTEPFTSPLASRSDDLRSSLSSAKAGQAMAPTGNRSNSYAGSDGDLNGNNDCRGLGRGVDTEEELGGDSSLIFFVVSSTEPFTSPLASRSDDLRSSLSSAKAGQTTAPTSNRSNSYAGSEQRLSRTG